MTNDEIEVSLERVQNLIRYATEEFEDGAQNVSMTIVLALADSARAELDRIVIALSPHVPQTEPTERPEDS